MNNNGITIALAGNPNAGKTSVFNALTGSRQHVGNYPGVTVEHKEGACTLDGCQVRVVDLPGTYSLTAYSLEEVVARNYLIGRRPQVVIDVVDASNLERNLYLAVQLMELGVPLVICLNMVDVAEQRGMRIDAGKLSELLGVPVVPTVARSNRGMDQLLRTAVELAQSSPRWQGLEISYGLDVDQGLAQLTAMLEGESPRRGLLSARWLALKCLEGDTEVLEHLGEQSELGQRLLPVVNKVSEHIRATLDDHPESVIADYRYGFITGITRQAVIFEQQVRIDLTDKIDKVLTGRLFGPAFLLLVLYGIYQFVFWASEGPVAALEAGMGLLSSGVGAVLPAGVLRSLVVSGVIDGVGGVLGFAPLIMFMFFAIAFMEDSGYMARVAYLMDRVLRTFGLHGNSVLAMIVGGGISGGCAVPGIMATRTLKDPRARVATILVVPFMNCGAKLPVYAVLIAAFFTGRQAQVMYALTLISWGLALLAARMLRSSLLRGEQAPFVMELPPYRMPTFRGLLIHTWERTWQYIKKAGTVILAVSIVIWAAMTFPALPRQVQADFQSRIEAASSQKARNQIKAQRAAAELSHTAAGRLGRWLTGLTEPIGFDWRTNVALVGGFAAKEVIVSTLGTAYSLGHMGEEEATGLSQRLAREPGWNGLKAFALMLFVMVYAPCFVTILMIRRETHTWRWPLFSLVFNTLVAYGLAFAVYRGGMLLGLG